MVAKCAARSSLEHGLRRLSAQHRSAHQPFAEEARDRPKEPALRADCSWCWLQTQRDPVMLWVIGSGLIVSWIVLTLFAPRGWAPLLLLSGICVLVVQIAAYRKTKVHR